MERPDRTGGGASSAPVPRCELCTDSCRTCNGSREFSSQDDEFMQTAMRRVQRQHETIDTRLNRSNQREPKIPTRPWRWPPRFRRQLSETPGRRSRGHLALARFEFGVPVRTIPRRTPPESVQPHRQTGRASAWSSSTQRSDEAENRSRECRLGSTPLALLPLRSRARLLHGPPATLRSRTSRPAR